MKREFLKILFYLFSFCFVNNLVCDPPKSIPEEYVNSFTWKGEIPVISFYLDDTVGPEGFFYSAQTVDEYVHRILAGGTYYYDVTDTWLYALLKRNPDLVKGKTVAVMGSVLPWYESVILAYGGKPYTIEYNKLETDDDRLTLKTVKEYEKNPRKFDTIISISSFEHDGLGRYGDLIDPDGDLKAMQKCRNMLNPKGKLILSVPVGKDCLAWNAHRIYGPIRLMKLIEGWSIVDEEGGYERFFRKALGRSVQPIFLLEPK